MCASSSAQKRLLADVDAIERRLRQEDAAGGDQLRHVPVDERQQQRRDVMAVGVGVGEDDDLAVAQRATRSKFLPRPQPSAVTRSDSSLFSSTFASDALSVFSTLPRSGRIAWRARSRPCFAEPPAESPSTMKSSLSSRPGCVQSLSLPGRVSRPDVARLARDLLLRRAARLARARREDDARDDRLGDRAVRVQPVLERRPDLRVDRRQSPRGCSGDPSSAPGTAAPATKTLSTPTSPSRMSSAVSVTPFGDRLCVSMKLRTALPRPARKPFSCVPPEPVGMPLT